MLKKLDTRAINALLKRQLLLSPELQRRYRAPNMDSMIFELRKLSYNINRFVAETDEDEALKASKHYLNYIKKSVTHGYLEDAMLHVTILEALLELEIGFPEVLIEIKEMVKEAPITFEGIEERFERNKRNNSGGNRH